jgi:ParB-like chromosome segregation protein Spo0J
MPTNKQPVDNVKWVDRETLKGNDYNPNHVAPPELELLKISIMQDGWTQPIVIREDNEIVDGFHRWTVSQDKEIYALTDGLVPVVQLRNIDKDHQMASTIRHNRARGSHNVLSMADIVVQLKDDMKVPDEDIMELLGMEDEEVERLYDNSGMTVRGSKDSFNKGWKPKK